MGARDTIAAIATAVGGGVGIVRVSGPHARAVAEQLCHPWPASFHPHHLYFVSIGKEKSQDRVVDPIDKGLFCFMESPHSYTGEDVLEVHAHGGRVVLEQILQAVLAEGVRLAQPGEFTKRAFLAGKMDLTQAEAVAAVVGASSERAARQAQRQLGGELRRLLSGFRAELVRLLGLVEGTLDFPDADEDIHVQRDVVEAVTGLERRLGSLRDGFEQGGKALHKGLQVVLVGKTNAGKSSLLNALAGSERVLVDAAPGTTRDVVEVPLRVGDVDVVLIDTAGERVDATWLEQQGLRLGKMWTRQADVVLLVVDGTEGMDHTTHALLHELRQAQVPLCIVWNKMDQQGFVAPPAQDVPVVACSALCGWGLDQLKQEMLAPFSKGLQEDILLTTARQAAGLDCALQALQQAREGLLAAQPMDLVASALRQAVFHLEEVTGEQVTEGVLDALFAQFCIGK